MGRVQLWVSRWRFKFRLWRCDIWIFWRHWRGWSKHLKNRFFSYLVENIVIDLFWLICTSWGFTNFTETMRPINTSYKRLNLVHWKNYSTMPSDNLRCGTPFWNLAGSKENDIMSFGQGGYISGSVIWPLHEVRLRLFSNEKYFWWMKYERG